MKAFLVPTLLLLKLNEFRKSFFKPRTSRDTAVYVGVASCLRSSVKIIVLNELRIICL